MMALLSTTRLEAFYGDFQALFGIDFEIQQGEIVAMIGANGAGKSTFLKTVCGLLKAAPDAIVFDGAPIGGFAPGWIVQQGIAMVPEGRRLFPSLSVEENLLMGAYAKRAGPWNLDSVCALFPMLKEKSASPATALSGGQQQMTAIIVEQDIGMAQKVSSRLYCLQEGRVTLAGASDKLSREQISHAYFGV